MKAIILLISLLLLFFITLAQGLTVTENDTIVIGKTSYKFNQNLTFETIETNSTTLTLNKTTFTITAPFKVNVTFNNIINKDNFNITFNATEHGTIHFNISGVVFTKEYIGQDKTIVCGIAVDNETNSTFGETIDNSYGAFNFLAAIFPFLMIMTMIFIFVSIIGRTL